MKPRVRGLLILLALAPTAARAGDANRLTYLDEFCNSYYAHVEFPKLTTPQWVGEPGVEAVVVLAIDDMRDSARYEAFLRPILDRLKEIDGRAPVSIMTCQIDPNDPRLQAWLKEGLSLETHTADHPCPCLQGGDFAAAKSTYDRCVDQLAAVPNSRPVAFRFPCMDSRNTPSPRAFAEILNKTTPRGNFLQISSSVVNVFTANDPALPRELVVEDDGRARMMKYLPFESFVNKVENYPYPFVVGRLMWEFPCVVPDDWQGQNLNRPFNPKTVADWNAAVDATVLKQGTASFVFHPHNWIRNTQMVEIIDHAVEKHGPRVKFLNFRECLERINKNLLAGQPLRAEDGGDNGVRLLDLNDDGYLDVVIGNDAVRRTRVWQPERRAWIESEFPTQFVTVDENGQRRFTGARFGVLDGQVVLIVRAPFRPGAHAGAWRFDDGKWRADENLLRGLTLDGEPIVTARNGRDAGVRLRDLDGDGRCELIAGGAVFRWGASRSGSRQTSGRSADAAGTLASSATTPSWRRLPFTLPKNTAVVDAQGRDAGLRFVDVDEDGHDDVIFSNESRYSLHLFQSLEEGWSREVRSGKRGDENAIPMISRAGTNNGAWFADNFMWVQNENTARLPDGVDRRSFVDLLRPVATRPKSPEAALETLRVHPGYRVELVAAEPLVMDPVSFDWGTDGKLWVVEMAGYPLGIDGKPGGRVRYLEDTDGDGRYDKSTLFLDGLNFPTGVIAWRDGVLVSTAPDIFYAEDADGDGRADRREVLYTGFGEGNQQHRVNGFWRGLDNWLYVANGDSGGHIRSLKTGEQLDIGGRDLRIRPDTGAMEPLAGRSQYGRARDDWGNWFGCSNSRPIYHFPVADRYFRRNPHVAPPAPRIDICTLENTPIYPIGRVLSHWSGYQPPPPGEPSRFTSANSVTIYRDNLLGPAFQNNAFVSEPVHNLVHRQVLRPDGTTFSGGRAAGEQRSEFLASSDSWFRPTTIRTGPDGALWVADMYRLVIEHPEWIDDQEEKRIDLRAGHERGRIYRIVPVDRPPRPIPRLDSLDTPALVAALDSPSGWQRDMAQQMLIWRDDKQALAPLEKMALEAERPLARLHALCTLDGLDALRPEIVAHALQDPRAGVRRHAIRLSETLLDDAPELGAKLLALLDDEAPQVRLQLAYSLGQWNDPRAAAALGQLAARHGDEPYLIAAVMSSAGAGNIAPVLASALGGADEQVLRQLLTLAAALGEKSALQETLQLVSRPRAGRYARWQLAALASVLEVLQRRKQTPDDLLTDEQLARLEAMFTQARATLDAAQATDEDRVAALQLLARARPAELERLAAPLAPRFAPRVQAAAVDALASVPNEDAARRLLAGWPGYSPALRARVLDALLSRAAWRDALLDALEKNTILPGQIDATARRRLLDQRDKSLAERAAKLFADSAGGDRREILAQYRAAFKLSGDAARGRTLFRKHCAACHRLESVGHAVGPDLAALTNKSPEALWTAILDPNRAVEDKFVEYAAITADGRTFSGMLAAETGTSITLRGQEGKEQVILRSELDALRASGKSLMPEGLEKELSVQDLADLIAYLAESRELRAESQAR